MIQVDAMPVAATGKIDKARLRAEYGAPPGADAGPAGDLGGQGRLT